VARDDDDFGVRRFLFDFFQELDPVHSRKSDIHQGYIVRDLSDRDMASSAEP